MIHSRHGSEKFFPSHGREHHPTTANKFSRWSDGDRDGYWNGDGDGGWDGRNVHVGLLGTAMGAVALRHAAKKVDVLRVLLNIIWEGRGKIPPVVCKK